MVLLNCCLKLSGSLCWVKLAIADVLAIRAPRRKSAPHHTQAAEGGGPRGLVPQRRRSHVCATILLFRYTTLNRTSYFPKVTLL